MSLILTEEKANEKLSSPSNLATVLHERMRKGGRTVGAKNRTVDENVAAAVLAETLGNSAASELTGISSSSLSELKQGKTLDNAQGRYTHDEELASKVKDAKDSVKENITEKATGIILKSFELLDDRISEVTKAKDLSSIAKDASAVVKNLSDGSPHSGVTVIIQAPRQRDISEYEVIDISPIKQ